ncbi:UNVERIFIED_CONTAM: hypothetical protein NCL1_11149 [Trichonephila clavipes]
MKRENLVSEVFGNEQSESDIRYKKLLQLCLIMPDDCLLRGLSQELYSKVLKREKILPKLGGMAPFSSPTNEFSFPLAAEFASARAPKFSPACVSERRRRI